MNVQILPGKASGSVTAPPSKSYAHRLLLCAALAEGESRISGLSLSEDVLATLDCVSALGAACRLEGNTAIIGGTTGNIKNGHFRCRESGSTLRFFIPAALTVTEYAEFTGSCRLMERGIGIYENLFAEKGILVEKGRDKLSMRGCLKAGSYTLSGNVSSQFISGLLFALPRLAESSELIVLPPMESRPYIDITLDVLRRFGVTVTETEKNRFLIPENQRYKPVDTSVEGDWSNAAFLYALNELGGQIDVLGLQANSRQGDRVCLEMFRRLRAPGAVLDISECPDLGPVLFALAAAKHGGVFTGTARLRIKECDRSAAMAGELAKFGVSVSVEENAVRVASGGIKAPIAQLDGHNDHRVVMALAVLASVVGGEICGADAVKKSWPDFFDVLSSTGPEVK